LDESFFASEEEAAYLMESMMESIILMLSITPRLASGARQLQTIFDGYAASY
jgi:hypothetical protein